MKAKTRELKIWHLTDKVLPFNLHLCVGPEKKMHEFLKKSSPEQALDWLKIRAYGAFTSDEKNQHYYLWLQDFDHLGYIVHECVHVVQKVAELKGIDIGKGDYEWLAYYLEFWVELVLSKKDKKPYDIW